MDVEIVKLSVDEARKIMPIHIADLVEDDNALVFGAFEAGDMLGCAVCTIQKSNFFVINYMKKLEGAGDEVYEALYSDIEEVCREVECRAIVARYIGDADMLLPLIRTLDLAGFEAASIEEHVVAYDIAQLRNADFSKKAASGRYDYLLESIKTKDELTEKQLTVLSNKLKDIHISANDEETADDACRYFVKNDKIIGFIEFSEPANGICVLKKSYVDKEEDFKIVMITLLASVFKGVKNREGEPYQVFFPTYRFEAYCWLENILGEPIKDYSVIEYVKVM